MMPLSRAICAPVPASHTRAAAIRAAGGRSLPSALNAALFTNRREARAVDELLPARRPDRAVLPPSVTTRRRRDECRAAHHTPMPFNTAVPPTPGVPHPRRTCRTRRCDAPAVGAEERREHNAPMAAQLGQSCHPRLGAPTHVPYRPARGSPCACRRTDTALNTKPRWPLQYEPSPPTLGVPHPRRAVLARRHHALPVVTESRRVHHALMPAQLGQPCAPLGVHSRAVASQLAVTTRRPSALKAAVLTRP